MAALLRAHDLSKTYGSVRALDRASFEVGEGITGLLGANGAGKSTALKIVLGLLPPDGGEAEFLHPDVPPGALARQRIGYMPEHDCLPDAMPAAAFLGYMAEVSGLPRAEARVRAADTLRHVGLFEERYRPIGTYSTGMKQRVKLAQALVHDPLIVLLDEPTAGLDPLSRVQMLALIERIGHDFGVSILLSSHLMGDVERTCDRVIVLDAGRVLREGPVSRFTEETETLEIEVTEGAEQLAAALATRGLSPVIDGLRLTLAEARDEDFDAVRDALVESGALLYRLAPLQRQLTAVFDRDDLDDGASDDGAEAAE